MTCRFSPMSLLNVVLSRALLLHLFAGVLAAQSTTSEMRLRSTGDSGTVLTLQQALDRARDTRPQVAVAAAGVERARGAARVATLVPNPNVVGQADERTPTHQLIMTQPLGWLLRRSSDVHAGQSTVERFAADSAQIVADLGRDVRRAFFGALAAQERFRLVSEQTQLTDSLLDFAERRLAAGDISALERDQIAQEARRMWLMAAQAREQARVAHVELGRAVAWQDDSDALRASGDLTEGLDAATSEATIASELTHLPALRSALADSSATHARFRATRWAQLPVPALIAGLEWGQPRTALADPDESRRTPVFGLSVPFPIWNQGREASAEARGAARESAARAAEVRLALSTALSAARIRTAEAGARARFARDTLFPEAMRVRVGAVRLYEAGGTGLLPVIDALRLERDAAQSLVQELLAYQQARADLGALLGQWP